LENTPLNDLLLQGLEKPLGDAVGLGFANKSEALVDAP